MVHMLVYYAMQHSVSFGTPNKCLVNTKKQYIQLRFHYPLAKQILIDTFAAWCDQKLDAQPWSATGQMTSHTHRMI